MTDVDAAADRRRRLDELVAEVYVPLQRYLRRRADVGTAEEALSDALLVLWRRLDDVPAEARLPWCYGVARRCLANAVRAEQRRLRLVERLSAVPVTEPPEDHRLAEALASCSDDDRELLRLWAWEELPPREIAVVLGVTPNAVSIRLHRALGRLRTRMDVGKKATAAGHLPGRRGRQTTR